jgi:acyl-CoA thioesterase I
MKIMIFTLLLALGSHSLAATEKPLVVVALGDSLTEGYGLTKEQAYPAVLQKNLKNKFPNLKIINAGVSGSTSASAESRLKWQLKNKPHVLLLALGANDGLRGLSTDSLKANLNKTIQLAQKNNIHVILAGMKMPFNYGKTYTKNYEDVFISLAKKYKLDFIPFLLDGVATNKKLNLADGIHPNEEGYRIIASKIAPVVEKALNTIQSSKGNNP